MMESVNTERNKIQGIYRITVTEKYGNVQYFLQKYHMHDFTLNRKK